MPVIHELEAARRRLELRKRALTPVYEERKIHVERLAELQRIETDALSHYLGEISAAKSIQDRTLTRWIQTIHRDGRPELSQFVRELLSEGPLPPTQRSIGRLAWVRQASGLYGESFTWTLSYRTYTGYPVHANLEELAGPEADHSAILAVADLKLQEAGWYLSHLENEYR